MPRTKKIPRTEKMYHPLKVIELMERYHNFLSAYELVMNYGLKKSDNLPLHVLPYLREGRLIPPDIVSLLIDFEDKLEDMVKKGFLYPDPDKDIDALVGYSF